MVNWIFIGVLTGNLLSLMAYTVLYGDNPIAKLTEHIFVGVAAGYLLVVNFWAVYNRGITKIGSKPVYLLAIVLIIMLYFRLKPDTVWVYRYPMAVLIAVGLGVSMRTIITSQLINQIAGTLPPIAPLTGVPITTTINSLIIFIGTITTILYLTFSVETKGMFAKVHKLGRYFLLIAFGGAYGMTVIFRYELIAGRMVYLVLPEVRVYTAIFVGVVAAILAYTQITHKKI